MQASANNADVRSLLDDLNMSAALLTIAENSCGERRAKSAFRTALRHYRRATSQLATALSSGALNGAQNEEFQMRFAALELRMQKLE